MIVFVLGGLAGLLSTNAFVVSVKTVRLNNMNVLAVSAMITAKLSNINALVVLTQTNAEVSTNTSAPVRKVLPIAKACTNTSALARRV